MLSENQLFHFLTMDVLQRFLYYLVLVFWVFLYLSLKEKMQRALIKIERNKLQSSKEFSDIFLTELDLLKESIFSIKFAQIFQVNY